MSENRRVVIALRARSEGSLYEVCDAYEIFHHGNEDAMELEKQWRNSVTGTCFANGYVAVTFAIVDETIVKEATV